MILQLQIESEIHGKMLFSYSLVAGLKIFGKLVKSLFCSWRSRGVYFFLDNLGLFKYICLCPMLKP